MKKSLSNLMRLAGYLPGCAYSCSWSRVAVPAPSSSNVVLVQDACRHVLVVFGRWIFECKVVYR